ncbi:uncharacterized protein LAESUDRAFT_814502 [Laetiporus sulphureus 93-53]|uniref:Poly(A) RNA polymerase mitochondrial-like central palm domain-containing protein n=1 Tax=Laetiporus sulphureus 93-53 TaxID=1314785 RepID=A0A165CWX9_9APHY|nr:uncharacterized protein LAESUDRAFT_814502 [Laetiporus sulphureus 93-53]KZT03621.1 hypothetical protein LAESUDRAFT_814502 [Laetiporus sulphureus 93-53]
MNFSSLRLTASIRWYESCLKLCSRNNTPIQPKRLFSNAPPCRQQSLYTPYVRPLNQEQLKTIRKAQMREEPQFHIRYKKDVEFFLSRSTSTEARMNERDSLRSRLESTVKSRFGDEYGVEDISMWRYGQDLHHAPLEYAIVDTKHPQGLSSHDDLQDLPPVYDPVAVSNALLKVGYKGYFHEPSFRSWEETLQFEDDEPILPSPATVKEWPRYERANTKELCYPPTLHGTSPIDFKLTLPGPTILPLTQLLKAYLDYSIQVKTLTSIYFLWARSLAIHDLSPVCVALMVIQYYQQSVGMQSLQRTAPTKDVDPAYVWVPQMYADEVSEKVLAYWDRGIYRPVDEVLDELQWNHAPYQIDVSFWNPPRPKTSTTIGMHSYNFARSLINGMQYVKTHALSVREGDALSRREARSKVFPIDVYNDSVGEIDGNWCNPTRWLADALVVQDPFVFTQNHAGSMSKAMMQYFFYYMSRTAHIIKAGNPFFDIFGPYIDLAQSHEGGALRDRAPHISIGGEAAARTTAPSFTDDDDVPFSRRRRDASVNDSKKTSSMEDEDVPFSRRRRGEASLNGSKRTSSMDDEDVPFSRRRREEAPVDDPDRMSSMDDDDVPFSRRRRGEASLNDSKRTSSTEDEDVPFSRRRGEESSIDNADSTIDINDDDVPPRRGRKSTVPFDNSDGTRTSSYHANRRESSMRRSGSSGFNRGYHSSAVQSETGANRSQTLRWRYEGSTVGWVPVERDDTRSIDEETLNALLPPSVPDEVHKMRGETLKRVQHIIAKNYKPLYLLEPFGSVCTGIDSPTSDIDIVIIDEDRPQGFEQAESKKGIPPIYDVAALGRVMRKARFRNVQSISRASVPIVKCKDPVNGLACDINVNERLGLVNSKLIRHYLDLNPVLRPMIRFLKTWAKSLGLNDPSGENGSPTFSSYALTLMTIGWFQICGLLPNLQAGVKEMHSGANSFFYAEIAIKNKKSKGVTRVKCDLRFREVVNWQPSETEIDLLEVLKDWFNYWGVEHKYRPTVMSVSHGGVLTREQALDSWAMLCQDPARYETSKKDGKLIAVARANSAAVEDDVVEGEMFVEESSEDMTAEEDEETSPDDWDTEDGKPPVGWPFKPEVTPEELRSVKDGENEGYSLDRLNTEDRSSSPGWALELDANIEKLHPIDAGSPAAEHARQELLEERQSLDERIARRLPSQDDAQPFESARALSRKEIAKRLGKGALSRWMESPLCVGDPFVPLKNVTGSIAYREVARFSAECRTALTFLESDGGLEHILEGFVRRRRTKPRTQLKSKSKTKSNRQAKRTRTHADATEDLEAIHSSVL